MEYRMKRSVSEYRQPKRAIEFTENQPSGGDCLDWFQWFASRGIPAAIVEKKLPSGTWYVVYRNWEGNPKYPCPKTHTILDSANGF